MWGNMTALTVCLLGTGTAKPTTIVPTIITTPVNPATKTTAENPATDVTSANPTSENPTDSTISQGTQKPHTTDAGPGPEPEGLSDGAIAGIAVGSIAGAAALGGGIFGLLKYTGKI
ncbi:unnamed protein product [Arctogadus glacialis]